MCVVAVSSSMDLVLLSGCPDTCSVYIVVVVVVVVAVVVAVVVVV